MYRTASQKDGASLQPQSHFKVTVISSVGKWTDILTSLHGCQCSRRNDWQGFWLCSLIFLQVVVFLPGSRRICISVECTVSFLPHAPFPEKERRPRIVPIFCLNKISPKLEVVSLLVVAMPFQCLGGKTEHWTMFWKEESQQRWWATGSREHANYPKTS